MEIEQNDKNKINGDNEKDIIENNIKFFSDLNQKNKLIEKVGQENKILNKNNEQNISLLKKEIVNIKKDSEKEINSLKDYINAQINLFKKELITNNNNNEIKEKKEKKINYREIEIIKEDINDLNDKYNQFERVFENKLDFIESTLIKLIDKDKIEKNNKKKEKDTPYTKDDLILNNFEKKLLEIFSEKNYNISKIDEKDLQELKNIANLFENDYSPLEVFQDFFDKNLKNKINEIKDEKILINIMNKKNSIYELFL